LLRTRSPFCGLPCDAPRSTTPMRTNRHLLPNASTTSTRASSLSGIFPKLALRSRARACTHGEKTGGPGVSRRLIRFGGPSGFARGVLLPRTPEQTVPLAPLSPPHSQRCAFARARLLGAAEIAQPTLREDEAGHLDPRCLPSVGDARAPARTVADLECGHVMVSASIRPSTPLHLRPCAALSRSHVSRRLDPRPRTPSRFG
jgi:hypothetical protein